MSKKVTPEESALIREAYKTGGKEAAKALRAELGKKQSAVPPSSTTREQQPSGKGSTVASSGLTRPSSYRTVGRSGTCDLCNCSIGPDAPLVSAAEFQHAVRNGLRPQGAMTSVGRALGVTDDAWASMALSDTTDWALCHSCFAEFKKY